LCGAHPVCAPQNLQVAQPLIPFCLPNAALDDVQVHAVVSAVITATMIYSAKEGLDFLRV